MSWSAPKDIAKRYYAFVKQCLTDEVAFAKFKTTEDYVAVVGMSHNWQSERFLNNVKKDPDILSRMESFRKNDIYGSPQMTIIDGIDISPNTLRHIQTLTDIKKNFGSLDNKIISELGVGYGATAFMIGTYYKPTDYYLIDLPDVQQFAQKYLNLLNIPSKCNPPPAEVDLFISEFCWTEFDDEDMLKFYDQYMKSAKNLYIMSNLFDEKRKSRILTHMNYDFELTIYPETHGTNYPSYVIVGKK
jgi:hypothetical protein